MVFSSMHSLCTSGWHPFVCSFILIRQVLVGHGMH
jgi:hypothetical protein